MIRIPKINVKLISLIDRKLRTIMIVPDNISKKDFEKIKL